MKKLLLLLLLCASAWGATGDISGFSVDSSGYTAKITVENLDSGGTYNFKFKADGKHKDSIGYTAYILVKRWGFDSAGTLSSGLMDTCWIDTVLRKLYPNQAADSETVVSGTVTFTAHLSQYVYSRDTVKSVFIPSGLYTKSGTPNNQYTASSATNNSIAVYPKVVGNWVTVPWQKVGSTFDLRAIVGHISGRQGKPVRAVKFRVWDASNDTVTVWSRSLSIDSAYGDSANVQEYIASISTSSLSQGEQLTCRFYAYPWYGDDSSVLNTGDGYYSGVYKVVYGDLKMLLDRTGAYGTTCACVDSVSGNDGTGQAYDSVTYGDGSSASCYQHISEAADGIAAYNNTNRSRYDHGAGVIHLENLIEEEQEPFKRL